MTPPLSSSLRRASAGLVAVRTARTHPQAPVAVEVARVEELSAGMRRITFAGPGLREYPALGSDHYARLLLPRDGSLVLPTSARWYPELLALGTSAPVLRNYTLRAVRPPAGEVDVDVVLHDGTGPAVTWARSARAGDQVGLIEQGAPFTSPQDGRLLLVADETGVPAALSILDGLSSAVEVTAVLEVAEPSHEIPCPAGVLWLHRSAGQSALEHVGQLSLPPGRAWLAGEAGLVTGLRRHLVRTGWAKADIQFTGYYRQGRAQYR